MATEDDRFSFIVEWYDPNAALIRKYLFHYYENDNTVEMYDTKNHRTFLRRCKAENVRVCDLYIGSTINVLSRQLTFVDYGNEYTRKRLGYKKERTLGLISPDAMPNMGKILDAIWQSGLQITKMKTFRVDRNEITEFYAEDKCAPKFSDIAALMCSGPLLVMEIRAENAVERWLDLLGPDDSARARQCAPSSLRARFGTDCIRNAVHGSKSADDAERELDFFFPTSGPAPKNTACYIESTCGIIKPHALLDGAAGDIITKILECGFEITAVIMVTLERANAEEFLEVYKGVVQEYPTMVTELCSGPSIALEVRAQDAAKTFREFVGPADPEIARHLRPRTLRALYGRTKTHNAVHCTDLPEDAMLEVEYFFKILDR